MLRLRTIVGMAAPGWYCWEEAGMEEVGGPFEGAFPLLVVRILIEAAVTLGPLTRTGGGIRAGEFLGRVGKITRFLGGGGTTRVAPFTLPLVEAKMLTMVAPPMVRWVLLVN